MKYDSKEEVISKMVEVFRVQEEVKTLLLYGSRARGEYRRESDIDLLMKEE